ncbi:EF-P lysine aminoacylase GenX [Acidihalobacter yilgarnensis]|uniref:EF-P lysine aminoacylase GenX n=2 Tax=Acidihalobacter yilgarnensis TaxID=2819280 RepID=A0A1D8IMA9_9GAMM|nr:EF-P lysine aminoacylase EpmA [Acidihalobacter yilgarnensis]AOU97607.1 EF-P lysine aminoacylase GenX [Acidihalobacter yilgarnensis]
MDWVPSAATEVLAQRAQMLAAVRDYFATHVAMEVETPALSVGATTDPMIESFAVLDGAAKRYLQTSPEFPMKRLLAAGSGDIYQICRVFRAEEQGRFHNPEFTLLEWYRLGWDDARLADEVVALIRAVADALALAPDFEVARLSYAQAFEARLGLDPHRAEVAELVVAASDAGVCPEGDLSRDGWLDLLMGVVVAPGFPSNRLTVVGDYPASQAALARIRAGDPPVAARFEVFAGGLELANGFHELTDADEQARRFDEDVRRRVATDAPRRPPDRRLIDALAAGLPDCAGVALGLDRLLLWLTGRSRLSEVVAFAWDRA